MKSFNSSLFLHSSLTAPSSSSSSSSPSSSSPPFDSFSLVWLPNWEEKRDKQDSNLLIVKRLSNLCRRTKQWKEKTRERRRGNNNHKNNNSSDDDWLTIKKKRLQNGFTDDSSSCSSLFVSSSLLSSSLLLLLFLKWIRIKNSLTLKWKQFMHHKLLPPSFNLYPSFHAVSNERRLT